MGFLDNSNWVRSGLATQIAQGGQHFGQGQGDWQKYSDLLQNNVVNPAQSYYQGSYFPLADQALSSVGGFNPQQIFGQSSQYMQPGAMQGYQQGMVGAAQGNPIMSGAQQGFQSGGMSPQYQQLYSQINALLSGQNPALQTQMGAGQDLVTSRGVDPFSAQYQQAGQAAVNSNPLLSLQQAATFAADRSANDFRNASEAARSQALARGGGPGSVVASGLQNDAMADFADQGMQAKAKAVQDALMQQQGLGLQQQGMLGNLGLQAGAQNIDRMQLGAGLLGQGQQAQNQLLNILGGTVGQQNQYQLGLGQLGQSGTNSLINALNSAYGNELGAGQLGLQQQNALSNALLGQMGAQGNLMGILNQQYQNQGINPYYQMMQFPMQQAMAGLGAQLGTNVAAGGGSPFGNIMGGIGALGQAASGFAGLPWGTMFGGGGGN